jgi:hypothetical protein
MDNVSISFSITFNTEYSEFVNDVDSVNGRLRSLNLSPRRWGITPATIAPKPRSGEAHGAASAP